MKCGAVWTFVSVAVQLLVCSLSWGQIPIGPEGITPTGVKGRSESKASKGDVVIYLKGSRASQTDQSLKDRVERLSGESSGFYNDSSLYFEKVAMQITGLVFCFSLVPLGYAVIYLLGELIGHPDTSGQPGQQSLGMSSVSVASDDSAYFTDGGDSGYGRLEVRATYDCDGHLQPHYGYSDSSRPLWTGPDPTDPDHDARVDYVNDEGRVVYSSDWSDRREDD